MKLGQQLRHLIYDNHNMEIPENYASFSIMSQEHSAHEKEVKPYPLSEKEHLFAVLWHAHDYNMLSATMLPSVVPFHFHKTFKAGTRTQMHSHGYLELFYVVEGEYRQKILGKEYTFQKGEVCLIDRNCLHQEILGETSALVLFVGISGAMFNDITKRQVTEERIADFLNLALLEQKTLQQYLHFKPLDGINADEEMEEALSMVLSELVRYDTASSMICQGLLTRIIRMLSTKYSFLLSSRQKKKMHMILFEEITDYMQEHLQEVSIKKLSEEFHFQEDYFNRLLKSHTGLTYTEYLQKLRLKQAEKLLGDHTLTIDAIVKKVGYKNKGYFYKIFLDEHQSTPAQFRNEVLKDK